MTKPTTEVLDAELVEVVEAVDTPTSKPRSQAEEPRAEADSTTRVDADANVDSDTDVETDADETTSTRPLPRAELLTGELWPEREVSRALVTTGIVCGVAGFALGYWFGNRERWSL